LARRRTRARSSSAPIVRTITTPAPIIRVSAPRAPAVRHKRRSKGGGAGKALTSERLFATALGGAVLGFIDKSFPNLPTLPLLGKAGTIAVAAYFFGKGKGGLVRDVAIAGASIAGYQIGTTGKISGDLMGDVMGAGL